MIVIVLSLFLFAASADGKPWRQDTCGRQRTLPLHSWMVGGRIVQPHRWPWMVAVREANGNRSCAGVLVSARHVLTATSCCGSKEVLIGSETNDYGEDGYKGAILVGITYKEEPVLTQLPGGNNFLLLTLEKEVPLGFNTYPIELPSKPLVSERVGCRVVGWASEHRYGDHYYVAEADQRLAVNGTWIEGISLYAGLKNTVEAGDFGGPLMCQVSDIIWELYGITMDYKVDGVTSEYGSVYDIKEWLEQRIRIRIPRLSS